MAKPLTNTQLVAALAEDMGTDKTSARAALLSTPQEFYDMKMYISCID